MSQYTIMKITDVRPQKQGYDVTVDFKDTDIDQQVTFFWEGETEPSLQDMNPRLNKIRQNLEDDLGEEISQVISREEVEDTLKSKGLITGSETWEDFKAASKKALREAISG